jgi:metallo-beta-lactamase family protein
MAHLTFHGGAGTVTGSRYLLETERGRLLVDCGLFQGNKELRELNWRNPGFEPRSVDAVVLTHAHIDHAGYLPRLVRDGFRGPIHATSATADLSDVMLRDSANVQEEDAEYANKKGFTKHAPALPLYTVEDAVRALRQFQILDYGTWKEPIRGLRFRFHPAGHIIGSGMVEMEIEEAGTKKRCVFSGDVGRYSAPLVPDPTPPPPCDVLVIESTYGDREHSATPVEDQLAAVLRTIVRTRGTAVFPAFAVGRAQQLIFYLRKIMDGDASLSLPIHLDSPMAVDATEIYCRHPEERGLCDIDFRSGSSPIFGANVFMHRTKEESLRLNSLPGPRVILSSSGMITGGRVLHHLRRTLPDEKNVVVLVGYQAPGTRGWQLQNGAKTLRIHGRDIEVRAQRIAIGGLSAHADSTQLVRWVRDLHAPKTAYIVHGDEAAPAALKKRLESELGFACVTPGLGDRVEL